MGNSRYPLCRPEKRSQALWEHNLTRDIRASDAPKAYLASGGIKLPEAALSIPLGIGAMPQKIHGYGSFSRSIVNLHTGKSDEPTKHHSASSFASALSTTSSRVIG